MKTLTLTRDNWASELNRAVTEKAGEERPLWTLCAGYYNVCIPSIVTYFSKYVWRLFVLANQLDNETVESALRMPARLAHAFEVVKTEIARIDKIRANDEAARAEVSRLAKRNRNHGRR